MGTITRYEHWLKVVCRIYSIPEDAIKHRTSARILLYSLCIRDNLCLQNIAVRTGKDRSNIRKFLSYQQENKTVPPKLTNWVYNLYNEKI